MDKTTKKTSELSLFPEIFSLNPVSNRKLEVSFTKGISKLLLTIRNSTAAAEQDSQPTNIYKYYLNAANMSKTSLKNISKIH